jgi:hypothetical protein
MFALETTRRRRFDRQSQRQEAQYCRSVGRRHCLADIYFRVLPACLPAALLVLPYYSEPVLLPESPVDLLGEFQTVVDEMRALAPFIWGRLIDKSPTYMLRCRRDDSMLFYFSRRFHAR